MSDHKVAGNVLADERSPEEIAREVNLLKLLQRVWAYAITTKSDLARDYADEIAEGSSRGFLTTQVAYGRFVYGRRWKLTVTGNRWLEAHVGTIADDEVENFLERE